ncbi:MAG: adenylosuccinate synthetase [Akkermansia sp.]|uniref:adenylosuccinate synthetase n=1 Tax=Akkermansia sp. TaxID=1872421 RepID=UPI00258B2C6F|nr:adenylosuccinate synthetase [Akkermansia sp.]MCD8246353.1 adenylosuccinate synthetase [Akkermansia sp.]
MSNINPFILTGMMPLSASSMNRVSYMCPVTISNDVVQGQTDIQDSLTVDSGGNLYIINAPVYVGGPNQPDHGHRTAHLVIRNGGAMTLLGNLPDHMTVFLGDKANGTTKRGIGPTYADKARRIGVRMADMRDPAIFDEVLRRRIKMANAEMERMGLPAMDEEKMVAEVSAAADVLRPHITNTIPVMHEAVASGKSILFEGAQGAYLDVDFGTYPFVTSSNTSSAGACTGTGVPPHKIDRIIGVCKAYTTRVGAGPFVTEDEDISNHLHSMGREFGATTGRPRRCGWADGVLLRFSAMFNGFDEMAMTNLDGYDKCPEIKICTGYDLDGEILAYPPATVDEWERCKPVYETVPGWMQDISSCRSWEEIPEQAKKFVKRMSELIGCPVTTVGVGPDREQTIAVQ